MAIVITSEALADPSFPARVCVHGNRPRSAYDVCLLDIARRISSLLQCGEGFLVLLARDRVERR
jgi:hypothetical protein